MRPPPTEPASAPIWRAQLDEIAAVLAETRATLPQIRDEVAALIAREAGPALAPRAVERLAARVVHLLAA